jgi:hypothetical protein
MNVEDLRSEVRACQSAQAELRKWKFVVLGTVAALGVGLAEKATEGSRLAIFILPLVALYPDLLVRDYDLRIALITKFMRDNKDIRSTYEDFVAKISKTEYPWVLGQSAMILSTAAACIAAVVLGTLFWMRIAVVPPADGRSMIPSFGSETSAHLLVGSGGLGIFAIIAIEGFFARKYMSIMKLGPEMANEVADATTQPSNPSTAP